jgi:hypothetical protein
MTACGHAAMDLVPRITPIEDEIYASDPDWAAVSYQEAIDRVEAMVRQRHPELDEQAVAAFGWAFSFDWK